MYSLLMMAAMATTPDTTSFGWRFAGCTGCTGTASCYGTACYGSSCYGSACYGGSCYGSSCYGGSACYGSSCYGSACYGSSCCGGGVLFPRLRGLFAGLGCRGASCYGTACYGSSCYGSSCLGSSCHGSSCHGAVYYGVGCYGSSCLGCTGSACYGSTITYPMSTGCTGCSGVIVGSTVPSVPVYGASSLEGTSSILSAKAAEPAKFIATLQLELPAKATLIVDGQVISGEGASRSFHTPELTVGQSYYYDFKAEVVIDGKKQLEEKRIVVRAGDKLNESFAKLIAAANTNTNAVASK